MEINHPTVNNGIATIGFIDVSVHVVRLVQLNQVSAVARTAEKPLKIFEIYSKFRSLVICNCIVPK